jgi:hypothetical protein
MQEEKQVTATKKKNKSGFRLLIWVFLFLILLVILLPLILHIKPVQNWLVNKAANSISEKTQAKAKVGKVDFSIFKGLLLEDVYLSSPSDQSDTLAHIGRFSSSLRENFTSLIKNSISLNEVFIEDVRLILKTNENETMSGFEKMLSNFRGKPSGPSKPRKSFQFSLEKIYFNNVFISKQNNAKGDFMDLSLKEGTLVIDSLDINRKRFVFQTLMLSNPIAIIHNKVIAASSDESIKSEAPVVEKESKKERDAFYLKIRNVEISNGRFKLDNWRKAPKAKSAGFDANHLDITDFNINASETIFETPMNFESSIKSLNLNEANGFALNSLNVDKLRVDMEQVHLDNFALGTDRSTLGDQLTFSYDDFSSFKKFAQEIEIEADLTETKLAFQDLLYFFPELTRSPFIKKNKNKWLKLSGSVLGTIDNLDTDGLSLSFSDLITMKGTLSTSALTRSESALVNLNVEKFQTSLANLKLIIPNFNPPEQFYKLDPIVFSGDIDGFFKDFVVYGTLNSPLGKVILDTRLDIKKGMDNAEYSGEMALENFDLGSWTSNPDLGMSTFQAKIRDGRGLTSKSLLTDLSAELQSFEFKGYTYSGVDLNGVFEQNRFNGKLTSSDPNAKLDFDGIIFVDPETKNIDSDFKAQIDNIDLLALNLSQDFSDIKGDIELVLKGSKSADLIGESTVNHLSFNFKGKPYEINNLYATSSPEINNKRNVQVTSDVVSGSIGGKFDFQHLPEALKRHMIKAHPEWSKKLSINRNSSQIPDQDFDFKFVINDSQNFLELANLPTAHIQGLTADGKINTETEEYKLELSLDQGAYDNIQFGNLRLGVDEVSQKSFYNLQVNALQVGKTAFSPLAMRLRANGDQLELRLASEEVLDSLEKIDIVIQAYPKEDNIIAKIADGYIDMLSSRWVVSPANEVVLGNKTIDINGFVIRDNYRSIIVSDVNEKGILVDLDKFDFELINTLIDYDKIDFTGEANVVFLKENIFESSPYIVKVDIPEFQLNDVDYGALTVSAEDNGDNLAVDLKLNRDYDGLLLHVKDFLYQKKSKGISGVITARNLAMNTFEFIIDDGISNTGGGADVDAVLSGTIDDINLDGVGQVTGGTTTIDYLGAELYFGEEKFIVTDKVIDLTGGKLYDKYRNEANIVGRLNHSLFTDFTSDLQMSSSRFLALDTDKSDNPSYYGQGIGDIVVDFSGPFSSTDILVEASSGLGTVINIPVGSVSEDYDQSLIKVVDRNTVFNFQSDSTDIEIPTLEGVDVRMNLSITPEAEINVIFNESINDIMTGHGDGNMRVVISRQGDFNIFGEYVIDRGEYLFTYFGGVISKPFTVEKGGQITWTGDPVNANINLKANYEKLKAPTNVFLAEYLNRPQDLNEARLRTDVDLMMNLTGTLYNPTVDFDIAFPELQGNIKNLADSKMRILKTNEADLNEQVAGLIMFGSFLPSSTFGNAVGSASGLASTGYNTLSEMISNQLSHILSGFLQEALSENGFVSGIDFDLTFGKTSQFGQEIPGQPGQPTTNTSIIPDEIEVHLKPRFQNDRWELDYGTSYINNEVNASTVPNYVVHDFNIGFYLTEDRRLKLKAYGKWDKNSLGDDGSKYGVGLNYRKEFGSLTDFKEALSDDIAKLKKNK